MKRATLLLMAISMLVHINAENTDYTNLIINSSFELQKEGVTNPPNTTWKPRLQDPIAEFYGWTVDFSELGTNNSQGINQDASNKDQNNVCWIGGNALLPELLEFHQTIDGLTAGTYEVRCRLAVDYAEKMTSQRLFANNNVQYYGQSTDYLSNLTAGEVNTFAGYSPAVNNLREMIVYTSITEGQPLKIGIRTGGLLSNGAYADQSLNPMAGWFKVDYFRLAKLDNTSATLSSLTLSDGVLSPVFDPSITTYNVTLPQGTSTVTPTALTNIPGVVVTGENPVDLSTGTGVSTITVTVLDGTTTKTYTIFYTVSSTKDYTASIINSSFEYESEGALHTTGSNPSWKPAAGSWIWGWQRTDFDLGSNSQGINSDFKNMDGNNGCWVAGTCILPELFEHYQVIDGLSAGTYKVQCRLAIDATNKMTTQRLFANNDVQYYGKSTDYVSNLTDGETNTFAGYSPTDKLLKEMVVNTTITEGQSLKLGIRTGAKLSNGETSSLQTPMVGWFKTDYFRLTKLNSSDPTRVMSLTGNLVFGEVSQNTTVSKTLTIRNTSVGALTIKSISLPVGFSADWTNGDIAANDYKDVQITFAPTEVKAYIGKIKAHATANGIESSDSITVSGLGTKRNTILPSNQNIQYMGRIDFTNPDRPLFAYANSTIKATFEGTSLDLLLKHYNGSNFVNNYFVAIVDGKDTVKFIVNENQEKYPVASSLRNGAHTVEIVKITESYHGECEFLGFQTDSAKTLLVPDAQPDLKLEFYGNSITCGYGIEGGERPASDNSYKAYPAVAARELNAQFHTISYSGIGVVKGFPSFLMGEIYNRTIAISSYNPQPANNAWDFTRYIPDYVVLALGTNDYNLGFGNGSITTATFKAGYQDLLLKIRTAYPNARIICTNSPMISNAKLGTTINDIVTSLNISGDKKINYFTFSHMQGGGAGGHPGVADGQTNGKELAAYIKTLINATSVQEVYKNKNEFTVFPNPSHGAFSITINNKSLDAENIRIYNLLGKKVKQLHNTHNVNVSELEKGVYILSVDFEGETYKQTMILK